MDPISLAASLAALIQLSTKAAQYLREIKGGSEDRIRLREEIRGTTCLLEMLQDRVDDADSMEKDLASIYSLKDPGGPMDQLTNALGQLVSSLTPKDRVQRLSRALLWPLAKKEAGDLIQIIERQKTALTLAYQNDTMSKPWNRYLKNKTDSQQRTISCHEGLCGGYRREGDCNGHSPGRSVRPQAALSKIY